MSKEFFAKYDLYNLLGSGSSGEVYIASPTNSSIKYAVKVMSLLNASSFTINLITNELEINHLLQNSNIVNLIEFFKDDHCVYAVFELCSNGDLRKAIVEHQSIAEAQALVYLNQLCQALMYMNEKNVIHRDIKSENLLLNQYNELKVSDFGLSCYGQDIISDNDVGSYAFFAPETHIHMRYSH